MRVVHGERNGKARGSIRSRKDPQRASVQEERACVRVRQMKCRRTHDDFGVEIEKERELHAMNQRMGRICEGMWVDRSHGGYNSSSLLLCRFDGLMKLFLLPPRAQLSFDGLMKLFLLLRAQLSFPGLMELFLLLLRAASLLLGTTLLKISCSDPARFVNLCSLYSCSRVKIGIDKDCGPDRAPTHKPKPSSLLYNALLSLSLWSSFPSGHPTTSRKLLISVFSLLYNALLSISVSLV